LEPGELFNAVKGKSFDSEDAAAWSVETIELG